MRFIPISTVAVEKLKQQAKKTKSKLGLKHAEALDRVARGAGYNHWGHVTWCAEQTRLREDGPPLAKEIQTIVDAAISGVSKLIVTGPELINRPLILFSTEDGDAWLIEPNEGMAMALCWHGEKLDPHVRDDNTELEIRWDGEFELQSDGFAVDVDVPRIGKRVIWGYPVEALRDAMWDIESFERRANEVFVNRETEPLTDELIGELVAKGWKQQDLEDARRSGAEFSPKRHSLLFPLEFG